MFFFLFLPPKRIKFQIVPMFDKLRKVSGVQQLEAEVKIEELITEFDAHMQSFQRNLMKQSLADRQRMKLTRGTS
eukprot:m.58825 g.58825  ORF g.58825 m.58825 type:complete len:75 (+) comp19048_c0_seq6:87-311(+)